MSFHLAGFTESVDQTLDNVAAIRDELLTVSGDDMTIRAGLNKVAAFWAGSATIERARLVTAGLRGKWLPDLSPLDAASEPVSAGAFHDFMADPIELQPDDVLNVQVENDGAGAGERVNAAVWLAGGPIAPAVGGWMPIRATVAAFAQTANVWNGARAITLSQTLPTGQYELGGAHAVTVAGTPVAGRFILPGQVERPGMLAYDLLTDVPATQRFRHGRSGVWGKFTHNNLPQYQPWSDSADNIEIQLVLDVRRVG